MIRKRIVLGAALMGVTTFASSAQWTQLAKSQDGVVFEIDQSSIERTGVNVKIWERRFFTPPRTWGQGDTIPTQAAKVRIFFNCANKTVAYKSTTNYGADGHILFSYEEPNPSFTEVVPDTMDEVAMYSACPELRK